MVEIDVGSFRAIGARIFENFVFYHVFRTFRPIKHQMQGMQSSICLLCFYSEVQAVARNFEGRNKSGCFGRKLFEFREITQLSEQSAYFICLDSDARNKVAPELLRSTFATPSSAEKAIE